MSRLREIAAGVGLAAGVLALLVVAGELAARALVPTERYPDVPPLPEEWKDLPQVESLLELAGANVRGINRGALFETNRFGFRGPEPSLEKPPGVFRIVVTGDSVPMGWGVNHEDTYAARLERALRETGRDVEVLNVSLAGQNAQWAAGRLEGLGLRFDPDLVVYGFTLNDIEGRFYRARERMEEEFAPMRFRTSRFRLVQLLGPRLVSLRELFWPPEDSYPFELNQNYFENEPAWDAMVAAFERLAQIGRQRDVCVVMLIHTRLYFLHFLHPFERHYDAVAAAARERGLFVVPTLDAFLGKSANELWVNAFDAHPNATGHAILADTLLEGLLALPDACWQGAGVSLAP